MRTIKFRAWDKENKQWINQNVAIADWNNSPYINLACIVGDNILELNSNKDWIWSEFTGLHDKNGKEIYEGDIIQANGIIFDEITFVIQDIFYPYIHNIEENYTNIEVIGNIYENPELLNKEEATTE